MLTAGLTSGLAGIQNTAYIQALSQNAQASKIGNFDDPNTLLNLNAPDVKQKITDAFDASTANLPEVYKQQAVSKFDGIQSAFSNKVVDAFSNSLQRIFMVSASLMFLAAILVFSVKEKPLRAASPEASPGVA
jgi:hypothetical protein